MSSTGSEKELASTDDRGDKRTSELREPRGILGVDDV